MHHKRIFISGGAGVIGTALVDQLLREGAHVFIGDLKPCPTEWIGRVQYRQGDLNTIRPQELQAFKPEIFFHLAATFERSDETYPFFDENFHHNVQLSHYLMNCLKEVATLRKVVFASSYLVYNPSLYQFEEVPNLVIPLKESDSIFPRNLCGAAKLFHEIELGFLEGFFKKQTQFISARIFRVYGCHSRDIISRWIRAALQKETLTIYCPEGRFDYIFADEVAEGLLHLARTNYTGIVNLGSGRSRSIYDVLKVLRSHFHDLKTEKVSCSIAFEASQADIHRLKAWTGWTPRHTLETAIPLIIEFERQQLLKPPATIENQAVLITSLSKKVPLIESVKQAAHKWRASLIYGCDSQTECVGRYSVDVFWHCPPLYQLTPEAVIAYCQKHRIRAIIPTRDADLEFYAKHLESFNRRGICVMVSSLDTIRTCLDKKAFAEALAAQGFPVIPTALLLDELKASAYVVKERYGAGSIHIGLNLSREAVEQHSRLLKEPVFQPYIEGKEWSVDLYRDREGAIIGTVARRRDMVVNGESQVTTTAHYPKLEALCQKMAEFLNIYGHAVFQVIEDSQENFHVVECNARFGGASTASVAVGLESFYWFLLECDGRKLDKQIFFRQSGDIRQIRYAADRILPWPLSSST